MAPEKPTQEPIEHVKVAGMLLDMDGTIIDSTPAIIKYWHMVGKDLGVDPDKIMHDAHGRRSIDTLKLYDESKATWDYVCKMEYKVPREFGQDAKEIPGARSLLDTLDDSKAPWAIVTSGTRPLIEGWLEVMKLARPQRLVTAEDVSNGKPDPECYRIGKDRLKLPAESQGSTIVVAEDAPAGIKAGLAAGCKVIGLLTSHNLERIRAAGPTWIVKDLESIKFHKDAETGEMTVEIHNAIPKEAKKTDEGIVKDAEKKENETVQQKRKREDEAEADDEKSTPKRQAHADHQSPNAKSGSAKKDKQQKSGDRVARRSPRNIEASSTLAKNGK